MTVTGPYKKRPVRFLELWRHQGWTIKVYGISAKNEHPSAEFVRAAKTVAQNRFPQPAISQDRYGAGIMIVHEGNDANFLLIDWWVGENMLQHHVYSAPLKAPALLEYTSPAGIAACVWELFVLAFERQAWVDKVLTQTGQVDLSDYYDARLHIDI